MACATWKNGYSEAELASAFIRHAESIDHLKLQKLCYFAHAWSLALRDRPLVRHPFQAWDYGPVLPELYQLLKPYGSSPILEPLTDFQIEEHDMEIVRMIYDTYGSRSSPDLVAITHRPDSPWAKHFIPRANNAIPDNDIREYFLALVRANSS